MFSQAKYHKYFTFLDSLTPHHTMFTQSIGIDSFSRTVDLYQMLQDMATDQSYYENMPIQIYRKLYHQKMKNFR